MSPAPGRRPGTRGVHALEDSALVLPDPLALDTSFVVRALIESEPLHGACASFLDRIVDAGVAVVTSELLEVELAEAAFAIALKERWGRGWWTHRSDGRARRRAQRLLDETTGRYASLGQSAAAHVSIPIGPVTDDALHLMGCCGLASYDAVHAASAIAGGAEAIVTTDTGFALLPASMLAIYTDRSRVAVCRSYRSA
jgi:predicted nucleic acid-binding protein